MRHTILMVFLAAATVTPVWSHGGNRGAFDVAKIDRAVVAQFREAWASAGLGNKNIEVVILIRRNRDGSYRADVDNSDKPHRSAHFAWSSSIIAVFHTHPNRASEKPSAADRKIADRFRVPIYTLTSRGIWAYDPAIRKTSLIIEGLRWLSSQIWEERIAEIASRRPIAAAFEARCRRGGAVASAPRPRPEHAGSPPHSSNGGPCHPSGGVWSAGTYFNSEPQIAVVKAVGRHYSRVRKHPQWRHGTYALQTLKESGFRD